MRANWKLTIGSNPSYLKLNQNQVWFLELEPNFISLQIKTGML